MSVRLCTVRVDLDHLVAVPLDLAGIDYRLDHDGDVSAVLVDEADVARAKVALERFGTFQR